jgi:uncharacterized protein YukE
VTGDGFDVTSAALTAHAGSVDGVADQVDQGRAAGAQVTLGRDACGQLCQFVPALIDPLQQAGVEAFAAAVDALRESADALRSAAGAYGPVDEMAAQNFGDG